MLCVDRNNFLEKLIESKINPTDKNRNAKIIKLLARIARGTYKTRPVLKYCVITVEPINKPEINDIIAKKLKNLKLL